MIDEQHYDSFLGSIYLVDSSIVTILKLQKPAMPLEEVMALLEVASNGLAKKIA